MQVTEKSSTIQVKDQWLICPHCGKQKVQRLTPTTQAKNLPVYCKRCGTESIVNIDPMSLRPRA